MMGRDNARLIIFIPLRIIGEYTAGLAVEFSSFDIPYGGMGGNLKL
jgi:hypothetical protein